VRLTVNERRLTRNNDLSPSATTFFQQRPSFAKVTQAASADTYTANVATVGARSPVSNL